MTAWDAYVGTVMRIEAPGGVVWVRPAPLAHTAGPYPDPGGRTIFVVTAHNPGGQLAPAAENAEAEARLVTELGRRQSRGQNRQSLSVTAPPIRDAVTLNHARSQARSHRRRPLPRRYWSRPLR